MLICAEECYVGKEWKLDGAANACDRHPGVIKQSSSFNNLIHIWLHAHYERAKEDFEEVREQPFSFTRDTTQLLSPLRSMAGHRRLPTFGYDSSHWTSNTTY